MTTRRLIASKWTLPIVLFCAMAIFLADLATPLGTSEWVLYILPLLFTTRSKHRHLPFYFAAICTLFMLLGFSFSPPGGAPQNLAIIGRCVGMFVIWTTAAILTSTRRQAEELENAERRFTSFMDSTTALAWIKDEQFQYVYINEAFHRVFNKSLSDLYGKTDFDLWPEKVASQLREHDTRTFTADKKWEVIETVPRPDKSESVWLVYKFPFTDATGKRFVGGMAIDITERNRTEQALRDSEARFRSIWNSSADGMRLTDSEGMILAANECFCKMMGLKQDEVVGKPISVLYSENTDDILRQYRERFANRTIETHLERKLTFRNGRAVHLEVANSFVDRENQQPLLLGIFRDISERKRHEEQRLELERKLLDSQKLESLGILAGGIAHDFNNLLTAMLGNAGLAMMQVSGVSPAQPYLANIERLCVQAADLCKQMLAYSGRGQFVVQKLDLNALIGEMGQLLQISINKKNVIKFNLCETLPPIEADASQMRQVIMNLIINASEAIGDKSGTITITSGSMQADPAYLSETYLAPDLKEGRYIYIEISDTGCGMNAETRAKIFDPFYTTKFTGRGLGLAAVLGIIRGHKGALKVYSEPGKGSSFKFLLPAAEGMVGDSEIKRKSNPAWTGTGTVLLADDEEPVRAVAADMLKRFGFQVLTAADGKAAVETFERHADTITAVVLDMTMPRMNGEEAFREIRRIRPDARILLTSGYNEQEATNRFVGKGLSGFLQKPFRTEELRDKIRAILTNGKS